MNIYQAIVLGIVQGLTEFLPISSSAHLVLIPWFFKWDDPGLAYDVALHWGTLLGVVAYYRRDLVGLATGWIESFQGKRETMNKLPWFLILATLPGALLGFIFEKQAETIFRSPGLVAGLLILMGILMFVVDQKSPKKTSLEQAVWWQALLIGFSQGLAIVPGISRSGITITTALLLGFERSAAVRFSFLLSIPIIAGAGLLKIDYLLANGRSPLMLAGILSAAISGFAAIHFLVHFIRTKSFTPFVIYRFALGALVLFATYR